MTDRDDWLNPAHPPTEPALDLGGGVWASWALPWANPEEERPVIWHWCDRSVYIAARDRGDESEQRRQDWWYTPCWSVAGVQSHDFISREPLHLEPSLYMPECCGLHGWVRDGKWVST